MYLNIDEKWLFVYTANMVQGQGFVFSLCSQRPDDSVSHGGIKHQPEDGVGETEIKEACCVVWPSVVGPYAYLWCVCCQAGCGLLCVFALLSWLELSVGRPRLDREAFYRSMS